MTLPEISTQRLEEEWAADKDLLASLREKGDRPEIVRAVDVSLFLGCEQTSDDEAIKALTRECLQIEPIRDVEYDGWGCIAEDGKD